MKRVESLDYLRGLMALAVMLYHYLSWSAFEPAVGGDYLLGKLGIYAVSIFYILSGLSLALVYDGRISTKGSVLSFYVKRFFRILPLFWVATTVALVYKISAQVITDNNVEFPLVSALLNYSLTFGFFDHDNYLTTGAWSIGNEMVFYSLFPLLFILNNRARYALIGAFVCSVVLGCWFAFSVLDSASSLSGDNWSSYINPFNQLFLFIGGVVVGKYAKLISVSTRLSISLLVVSLLVFILLPAASDKIDIVTGINRLILSFSCMVFVFATFKLNPVFHNKAGDFLKFLGECCYSIYLLHALVAFPFIFIGTKLGVDKLYIYIICVPITLICSYFTFKYVEQPSITIGKRFAAKVKNNDYNIRF